MKKSKTLVAVLVLVVLIILSGLVYVNSGKFSSDNAVTPTPTFGEVSVSVKGKDGKTISYTDNISKKDETALDVMNDLKKAKKITFEGKQYSFGFLVTGINGYTPDASKAFWDFEVNGKSSSVGVSTYKVKNHDKIGFVPEDIK